MAVGLGVHVSIDPVACIMGVIALLAGLGNVAASGAFSARESNVLLDSEIVGGQQAGESPVWVKGLCRVPRV